MYKPIHVIPARERLRREDHMYKVRGKKKHMQNMETVSKQKK